MKSKICNHVFLSSALSQRMKFILFLFHYDHVLFKMYKRNDQVKHLSPYTSSTYIAVYKAYKNRTEYYETWFSR